MTWAPIETQKALFAVLNDDATLTTLIGADKVFDHVPDNTEFPYISMQILPWIDQGSHTVEGMEAEIQINVWYQETTRGTAGVATIQKRIDELLHKANITVSGWDVILMRRTFVDILSQDDNVTLQGVQRFQIFLGE